MSFRTSLPPALLTSDHAAREFTENSRLHVAMDYAEMPRFRAKVNPPEKKVVVPVLDETPSQVSRANVNWLKNMKGWYRSYSSEVSFLASSGGAGCRKASMGTHLDFCAFLIQAPLPSIHSTVPSTTSPFLSTALALSPGLGMDMNEIWVARTGQ